MTTATILATFSLPTTRQEWIKSMDVSVAKVAIICATVLGVAVVGGVIAVAVLGGDVAALSLALGTVVAAGVNAWAKIQGKKVDANGAGKTPSDT